MTTAANALSDEIIIAGFGGQGVILAGKLLTHAAMISGREVTYMPSYGAEVRGGTANCMVVIGEDPIASPLVTQPSALIVMNKASFNKFIPILNPGGLLVNCIYMWFKLFQVTACLVAHESAQHFIYYAHADNYLLP